MLKLQYCIIKMDVNVNGDGGAKELLEAQAHVWRHTLNYMTSMALKCAVELGIPDIISNHHKPLTLPELVRAVSIPEEKTTYMHRLMRMLVHCGFFALEKTPQDQEGYVLTPSSRLLSKNHGTDLSPFVLIHMHPAVATSFHFMSQWFRGSDLTSFKTANGMEVWNYFGQFPDVSNTFNAGMASDSKLLMPLVIKDHRKIFEGFGTLVDVGGGIGTVATALSEAFPAMRCVVLDLPRVVLSLTKGSKNIEFVGGDMFESIPSADIMLLKWILHDWNDEECVNILRNCREALSKYVQGKVVIIDIVIDKIKGMHEMIETQLCCDIFMMGVLTGKERSETEWEKLFLDAGFTSYKITHGLGLRSIIEVFP